MRKKKGFYSISVVAKMFSVHQQTIRMYEKEGLITPKRSGGNTRLFSESDVERLEEIINLTHKMGINLAGVEMILKLQKKVKKLQFDINKMFSQLSGQFDEESKDLKQGAKEQAKQLVKIKQENLALTQKHDKVHEVHSIDKKDGAESNHRTPVVDDWEIEYDEK